MQTKHPNQTIPCDSFLSRMEAMLGTAYPAFRAAYEPGEKPFRGVRLNPLKCSLEQLRNALPFALSAQPTPFSPLTYYAPADEKFGFLPAHHAGMFYAQEPSAASAVTVLDPQPGDRILDLCAAPGGKSTQIAAMTKDCGLLVANEYVSNRADILCSNLERMGVKNAVVTCCHPEKLCQTLGGWFDRVLVDAPCSGEGMFRHDSGAISEWTPESPVICARRQNEILDSAANAVAPGGILVYSTCTFSMEENENTVLAFLERHPDFEPADEITSISFGRSAFALPCARRIFPMDGGEGHFVAKLRRRFDIDIPSAPPYVSGQRIPKQLQKEIDALYCTCFTDAVPQQFCLFGDTVYIVPDGLFSLNGLGVRRAGYAFARVLGNRLEPCHGAFLCHAGADCRQALHYPPEDALLRAFLSGEEIPCDPALSGWAAVCLGDVVTGFGKACGGRLKNKYPKGLRLKNRG